MKTNRIRYAVLATTAALATAAYAQSNITVMVNGNPVQFAGQGPMMNGDRVFVPLRGVFQSMGANVDWDPSTQTVRADRGGTHVRLTIGQLTAAVNGQPTQLDVAAQIVQGSTMVPLRFVGEALGGTVNWDAPSNTVAIQIGGYAIPRDRDHRDRDRDRPHFAPPPPHQAPPPVFVQLPPVIHMNTVIQASLNIDLNASHNHRGDVVFANINDRAAGLPPGTRVRGVVDDVRPRAGNRPGNVSVRFSSLILPNGKTMPINAEIAAGSHGEHIAVGTKLGIRLKNDVHFHK